MIKCMRENSQDTRVILHPLPTSTLSEIKARLTGSWGKNICSEQRFYNQNHNFTSDLKNWFMATLDP